MNVCSNLLAKGSLLLALFTCFCIAQSSAESVTGIYKMNQKEVAEHDAEKHHLPLAWISVPPEYFRQDIDYGDNQELSFMALRYLGAQVKAGRLVVILFLGNDEVNQIPNIVHMQIHQQDDGPLKGGASYMPPKIIFCSGDTAMIFGRVSYTQMKADRETAIETLLQHIESDPDIQTKLHAPPLAITPEPVSVGSMVLTKTQWLEIGVVGVIVALVALLSVYRSLLDIFVGKPKRDVE